MSVGRGGSNELFINKSPLPKDVRTNSTRRELEKPTLKCVPWKKILEQDKLSLVCLTSLSQFEAKC
jgi:hypothetical protein